MRTIVAFIFLLTISSSIHAQTDTSIIGVWKIVSIEMDGVYYNFKKDSISISEEKKELYTDEAKKKHLSGRIQMVFSVTEFHFEKNGILKQKMMGEIFTETYKINTSQAVIEIISKNSLNEDVTDKIKYDLKNGLLSLTLKWGEDDEEFNLVFEKV